MKTFTPFSALAAATAGCVCGGTAIAAHPAVARKTLLTAQLNPAVPTVRVEAKEIAMAPGVKAGLHLHPCPVVGVILRGSIAFQIEGEARQTLRAGDTFFEPANRRIAGFDNDSDTPAVFTAFYLVSHDGQELITMLPR